MEISTYRRLDAVAIAGLVRAGETDPREVTEAALAAVAGSNPRLNAVVLLDPDRACLEAAHVDRAAPLAGVPVLIKDNNLFVEGWPTTFSSRFYVGTPPKPEPMTMTRFPL